MRTLHHFSLCPFSRFARIILIEKEIPFKRIEEKFWLKKPHLLALNPSATLPILIEQNGLKICEFIAIADYLEHAYPTTNLYGASFEDRAENHRLMQWFGVKFSREVMEYLYIEKIVKHLAHAGQPNSSYLKAGRHNLTYHLDYLEYLLEQRKWLGSNNFSYADAMASAQLSTLDYMNMIPWNNYPEVASWYAKIKSRPSFRPILEDSLPGFPPAIHYANLDF